VAGRGDQTQGRRYLSAAQVEALADAAGPGRAAVLVLSYCGLRWSELAALRVRNFDLLRRRVIIEEAVTEIDGSTVVWGTPKTHSRRSVPLPRLLVDELARTVVNRPGDELAFPSPQGAVLRNRNARAGWFDDAACRAGLAGLTPHELRHTAVPRDQRRRQREGGAADARPCASAAMTCSTTTWTTSPTDGDRLRATSCGPGCGLFAD
jgi:integrase